MLMLGDIGELNRTHVPYVNARGETEPDVYLASENTSTPDDTKPLQLSIKYNSLFKFTILIKYYIHLVDCFINSSRFNYIIS